MPEFSTSQQPLAGSPCWS